MRPNPYACRSSLFHALLATVFALTVCSCGGSTSKPEGKKNTAGRTKTPNTPTPTPTPVKTAHETLDAVRSAMSDLIAMIKKQGSEQADGIEKRLNPFLNELESHFNGDINCTLDSDTIIDGKPYKKGSTLLHVLMADLSFALCGLKVVKANGGDLGKKDEEGNTPLHNFVSYTDPSHFRDYNQYDTLLKILDEEQAKQLVQIQNNNGDSPLHIDALGKYKDAGRLIEVLRKKLGDYKTKKLVQNLENSSGQTPHQVAEAASGHHAGLVKKQYAKLFP